MRILVLKRDKLGDMLLATPMLSVLRSSFPQARIDVLANTYNAWVLDGNTDVNTVWRYQKVKEGGRIYFRAAFEQLRQVFQLRKARYDWIIVGNGDASHRAIKRAAWLGGKKLVSYVDEHNYHHKVTTPLPLPPADMHETRRMIQLLEPLGVVPPKDMPSLRFQLPTEGEAFATQWLAERKIPLHGYITLGLGARRAKRQPTADQVLRWSRYFHTHWGLQTVFMWTPGKSNNPLYPGDDEIAQPVLDAQLPWLHPFRGALKPALGLIWKGRTNIFPDSGLMHFAAASPGGVLGLFAEIEASPPPTQWGPVGPHARWLAAPKRIADLADEIIFSELEPLLKSEALDGSA